MQDRQTISAQSTSYRRGLVMGLTMAEVCILIIFVLIMLIGINQWRRYQQNKIYRNIKVERLQALEESEASMAQLKKALNLSQNASVDEIQMLIRAVQESAADPSRQSALIEARNAIEEMRKIERSIANADGSKKLAEQVALQSHRIANQEGQLQRYESRLLEAGLGKGERPCWVQSDGTIDYLYDVVLENNGIRMRERQYPLRKEERALLPMPLVVPKEVLSQSEFVRRTFPLYEHSLQSNCRFFVVVYDGTGPLEKEKYKALLKTVEGHFYKWLDNGKPPF